MQLISFLLLLAPLSLFALEEDSALIPPPEKESELVFSLTDSSTTQKIPFISTYLARSKVLLRAFKAAKGEDNREQIPEVALIVPDIESFKLVLNFLAKDSIDSFSYEHLPDLIDYAHEYEIDLLGIWIKDLILANDFIEPNKETKTTWFVLIAKALRKIRFQSKQIEAEKHWAQIILESFLKYIFLHEHIDNGQLKRSLNEALADDKDFIYMLNNPNLDFLEDIAKSIGKRRSDIEERKVQTRKELAAKWAEEKALIVAQAYIYNQNKNKTKMTIEFVVDVKDAQYKSEALAAKLTHYKVVLDSAGEYSLPRHKNICASESCFGCFFCPSICETSQDKDCSFGKCLVSTISTTFQVLVGTCLQIATCGYLCCCTTDCHSSKDCCNLWCSSWFDDRTSDLIFYGIYDGVTCLRNIPKGKFGPTRIITVSHK